MNKVQRKFVTTVSNLRRSFQTLLSCMEEGVKEAKASVFANEVTAELNVVSNRMKWLAQVTNGSEAELTASKNAVKAEESSSSTREASSSRDISSTFTCGPCAKFMELETLATFETHKHKLRQCVAEEQVAETLKEKDAVRTVYGFLTGSCKSSLADLTRALKEKAKEKEGDGKNKKKLNNKKKEAETDEEKRAKVADRSAKRRRTVCSVLELMEGIGKDCPGVQAVKTLVASELHDSVASGNLRFEPFVIHDAKLMKALEASGRGREGHGAPSAASSLPKAGEESKEEAEEHGHASDASGAGWEKNFAEAMEGFARKFSNHQLRLTEGRCQMRLKDDKFESKSQAPVASWCGRLSQSLWGGMMTLA